MNGGYAMAETEAKYDVSFEGAVFWFSEYRDCGRAEKFFGNFCNRYLPDGKKRLIFAVLLKEIPFKIWKCHHGKMQKSDIPKKRTDW